MEFFRLQLDALHLKTTLIYFLPAMPLNGPSNSKLDSKDEIGSSRKHHEDGERGTLDMTAGPSNITAAPTKPKRKSKGKGSGQATPDIPAKQKSPVAFEESSFENNGDFIALRFEDDPEVHDHFRKEDKEEPRERDWDKGKGKALERDNVGGKKRKADFDRNDRYNKKERMDAASRKAPWVTDVDWDGCANVAELSASFHWFYCVVTDDTPDYIERSRRL
jgi:non-canonical poly(A) RNA polymerase PAPD5/7